MVGDKSKFTTFLKGLDIARLDDCIHFQLDDMDFIYILSDGKEYIIPLNDNTAHMDAAKRYDYSVFKSYVANLLANGDSTGGPSTEPNNASGGSTKSDDMANTRHVEIYMICAAIVIVGSKRVLKSGRN